jgi:dynein heavy chain
MPALIWRSSQMMELYKMLGDYLPSGFMKEEEIDNKTVLRSKWKKLATLALTRTDELSRTQIGFKRDLIRDVAQVKKDVVKFRRDYIGNGPMVEGLAPTESLDRLSLFREELEIREHKFELYRRGESLFALRHQEYPDLGADQEGRHGCLTVVPYLCGCSPYDQRVEANAMDVDRCQYR